VVSVLLERGEFFIAAQVVVFCQLRLFLAELLNQLAPAFCRSFTLFAKTYLLSIRYYLNMKKQTLDT